MTYIAITGSLSSSIIFFCTFSASPLKLSQSYVIFLGAVIIFTALLSVAFLGSTIRKVMWTGIFIILVGLALVGVSDIIFGQSDAQTDTNGIIAGKLIGLFE